MDEHRKWLRVICESPHDGSCTCADDGKVDREMLGCVGRWEAAKRVAEQVAADGQITEGRNK